MPPKKGKKKANNGGVGSALINSKARKVQKNKEGNHAPIKYEVPDTFIPLDDRLRSKTDDYTLGDYVTDAELQGKKFEALRGTLRIVDKTTLTREAYQILHKTHQQLEAEEALRDRLKIPRRPKWDENTTADELHDLETAELIEWRRSLSVIEEDPNITLSPFEKNGEVWKELWRVLERSQVAVYILDLRDPLAFFCDDFFTYMNELHIPVLLALNKADLVPPPIRNEWHKYFEQKKIEHAFVSVYTKEPGIMTPTECVQRAASMTENRGKDDRKCVGFVGFPNVGKSSFLNSVVGKIVCKSSSTPGKTKHLQTFILEEQGICLCDCPGLVFPLFQMNRASMICNGILSIETMTEYRQPIAIVCSKVPTEALNVLYGLNLEGTYVDPEFFLQQFALTRGFYTASGNPDEAKVAKIVLRDYTCGKLMHCELPPGVHFKSPEAPVKEKPKEAKPQAGPSPEQIQALAPQQKDEGDQKKKKRGVVRVTSFE